MDQSSVTRIPLLAFCSLMDVMKTVDEIRRARLAELVLEYGTVAKLALKIGKSAAQVSQWLNGSKDSKTGKPRGFRKETARYIEDKCNKSIGWLDGLNDVAVREATAEVIDIESIARNAEEKKLLFLFRQLDVKGGGIDRVFGCIKDEIRAEHSGQSPGSKSQGSGEANQS